MMIVVKSQEVTQPIYMNKKTLFWDHSKSMEAGISLICRNKEQRHFNRRKRPSKEHEENTNRIPKIFLYSQCYH